MEAQSGHPKGLYVLFITEMWERFSYYGMRAIFMLYMIKSLAFDAATASNIYGSYTGLVYLTPLIGGFVSDKYWGNRKSIFVGGLLMALGQFTMFFSASNSGNPSLALPLLYLGLGLLIFGNGFFKPNISTMVGQLYSEGDKRVDSAFTIFYMGINLGAFFSPLVCGYLGENIGYQWGFLAAGIGMVISVVFFELTKNKYIVTADGVGIGLHPSKKESKTTDVESVKVSSSYIAMWVVIEIIVVTLFKNFLDMDIIGSFIFATAIVGPLYIIMDKSLSKDERERILAIYIIAFFVIFFWACFEQAGASLTIFADKNVDRHFMGTIIPASFFQSVNAVAIVIFAPIFAWLWIYLGKKNLEPASPIKQAIGLFLLSLSYFVIAFGVEGVSATTKVSMMWLMSLYILQTFGELCLSPIGLSMVNKLAPLRFASLLMGVWFLSNAAANKFAGSLSALIPLDAKTGEYVTTHFMGFYQIANLHDFFMLFMAMSLGASILLFVMYKWLAKLMHGIH
jgi:POT family proton-dependent oligopeptide transporter